MTSIPLDQTTIATIAAMSMSPTRNRLITQTYHQLSRAIADLHGGDCLNWFHFATWSSYSVGRIITGQTLPASLRQFLTGGAPMLGGGRHLCALVDAIENTAADVARGLSEGNDAVFADLAPVSAAFVEDGAGCDPDRERLASAFDNYRAAGQQSDPSAHAQLVLAGSLGIGAEEQALLQPFLASVLCAGVTEVFSPIGIQLGRTPLGHIAIAARAGHQFARLIDERWDREMTRHFLVLELPGERLHLGDDVPPLVGEPLIPHVTAKPTEPALIDLLDEFDRTGDSGRDDRASDWTVYDQRMDWIAWLFRSRQFDQRMRQPPFTAAEVQQLRDALAKA